MADLLTAKSRKEKTTLLPAKFEPRFWNECDARLAVVRTIRRRVEELAADVGCDSVQKRMLVERAAFLDVVLETAECRCAEGGVFDVGQWTQASNALSGILSKLGLERHQKPLNGLQDYIKTKKQKRVATEEDES